jgi:hypothetical protein
LEYIILEDMISSVSLSPNEDVRSSMFERKNGYLNSARIYRTATSSGVKTTGYKFIWRSHAPPKVKFFGWLLLQNRLQCRVNLHRKGIVEEDVCPICQNAPKSEDHMLRDCSFVAVFWLKLGVDVASIPDTTRLWEISRPGTVPHQLFPTLILLCCWHLWKHRHGVVFRSEVPNLERVFIACKEDCRLWSHRFPRHLTHISNI